LLGLLACGFGVHGIQVRIEFLGEGLRRKHSSKSPYCVGVKLVVELVLLLLGSFQGGHWLFSFFI